MGKELPQGSGVPVSMEHGFVPSQGLCPLVPRKSRRMKQRGRDEDVHKTQLGFKKQTRGKIRRDGEKEEEDGRDMGQGGEKE